MMDDKADLCPECQAVEPWVEENDERICRQCGYVEKGLEAAKFRNEGEYVNPIVDIYLKNPAFRDETGAPSKRNRYGTEVSQRVQSRTELFAQMDGCVRNTLGLPNIISHRAWNMLEIIQQKRGKKNVTQGMKLLAMSVTLVAAREAGHVVPNSLIASLTRRSLADVQADIRSICKLLDLRYEEYRGVSEQTQVIVSAASEIAQQYQQKNLAADPVTSNKEFTSTLQFCLAYQSRMHLIDGSISQLQRFIQLTGIWHRRKLDICDITTVFIALQLISVKYIRYHTFLMNDFQKYVNFNPEACQLRMREFHRMTMDLAFYLPQIGKARFIPELLEPWNGRTTRPIPEAQLFVLLLPDVLDNMQQLWEKRLHELTLQKGDSEITIDVEARLKTAISAFLSPPDDQAMRIRQQSEKRVSSPSQTDGSERSNDDTSNSPVGNATSRTSPLLHSKPQLDTLSAQELPASTISSSPLNGSLSIARATDTEAQRTDPTMINGSQCLVLCAASSDLSTAKSTRTRRKRKLDGMSSDGRIAKRVDRQSEPDRSDANPTEERRLREETLHQFKQRITTRQTNDLLRQHFRQQHAMGMLAPDLVTSARAAYGSGIAAHSRRTRLPQRIPQVLRLLEEWQSAQLAETRIAVRELSPPYRSCYEYDTYWLKKDLRDGKAASLINIHRFPPSVTMAKAMLHPFDFESPFVGSEDDSLFEPGELDSYLGDDEYTKCRLEVWHAQGMEESATRRAAVSQRAMEIASQRQPRMIGLAGLKRSQPNYDLGRMTELLSSLRAAQDGSPSEYGSYISRQVGQAISLAVNGSAEKYKLGSHNDCSSYSSSSSKEDVVCMDGGEEKPDDEGLEVIGDCDYEVHPHMLANHGQEYDDIEDEDEDNED